MDLFVGRTSVDVSFVNTPHGRGKLFYSLGDQEFVAASEGFAFVPEKMLGTLEMNAYQSSRYGEISARCWPVIRVAHALPDVTRPATLESPGALAFLARLNKILGGIPRF